MARRKRATENTGADASTPVRPGDADVAGGADDASLGAQLAVKLLVKELRRLDEAGAALDGETGQLVALYARTLSAIENARARRGQGKGDLADKGMDELLQLAMQDPALRDAIKRFQ